MSQSFPRPEVEIHQAFRSSDVKLVAAGYALRRVQSTHQGARIDSFYRHVGEVVSQQLRLFDSHLVQSHIASAPEHLTRIPLSFAVPGKDDSSHRYLTFLVGAAIAHVDHADAKGYVRRRRTVAYQASFDPVNAPC